MKCPFCGEPLVKLDEFNVSVNVCPSCRALCLAHGAFERILRMVSQTAGENPVLSPAPRNGRPSGISITGVE